MVVVGSDDMAVGGGLISPKKMSEKLQLDRNVCGSLPTGITKTNFKNALLVKKKIGSYYLFLF